MLLMRNREKGRFINAYPWWGCLEANWDIIVIDAKSRKRKIHIDAKLESGTVIGGTEPFLPASQRGPSLVSRRDWLSYSIIDLRP
jgi:hypothetical protein